MTPAERRELSLVTDSLAQLMRQAHANALTPQQATYSAIRRVIEGAFAPACGPYADEVSAINLANGLLNSRTALRQDIRAKFVGGHPGGLGRGRYVLALTLNHQAKAAGLSAEQGELNHSATHASACLDYFTKGYAYFRHPVTNVPVFFAHRAEVLRAYATARNLAVVTAAQGIKTAFERRRLAVGARPCSPAGAHYLVERNLNEELCLYLEQNPYWSANFRKIDPLTDALCLQLNRLLLAFLLRVLPPGLVWLVGGANLTMFDPPPPRARSHGATVAGVSRTGPWVEHPLRGRPGVVKSGTLLVDRVALWPQHEALLPGETRTFDLPVAWCNFLGMPPGPNGTNDYRAMGQLLAQLHP